MLGSEMVQRQQACANQANTEKASRQTLWGKMPIRWLPEHQDLHKRANEFLDPLQGIDEPAPSDCIKTRNEHSHPRIERWDVDLPLCALENEMLHRCNIAHWNVRNLVPTLPHDCNQDMGGLQEIKAAELLALSGLAKDPQSCQTSSRQLGDEFVMGIRITCREPSIQQCRGLEPICLLKSQVPHNLGETDDCTTSDCLWELFARPLLHCGKHLVLNGGAHVHVFCGRIGGFEPVLELLPCGRRQRPGHVLPLVRNDSLPCRNLP
mmetsp:Transcript_86579/g.218314  ORF Transcript_86579/g.218314 Transcript_86579/m.218314 type:complete len:265 (+) Transcript_86579:311-1105(+)